MRNRSWVLFSVLSFSLLCFGDWPQWRGPNFNGTSNQTNLPNSLDPNTVVWKTALPGPGEATPTIVGERLYLSGYEADAKTLFAMCINAETGKVLWKQTPASFEKLPPRKIIASPSPVADENGVVFLYSEGTLVKYTPDGTEQWKRNLVDEYGPFKLGWSYSSSPLLYDGRLYVAVMRSTELTESATYTGSMTSYLLGIDPATGKNIFKVDRPTDATDDARESYTTPIPTQINGQTQILLYGGNYLTAHDPATGAELWRQNYMDEDMRWRRAVATPIVAGDVIYCAFPMGKKVYADTLSKLGGDDDARLWTYTQSAPDIPTPVLVDEHLYFIQDNKKKLTCLDAASGTEKWVGQLDKADTFYASITAADGKLYTVNRKGAVTVVAADPDKFRILGRYRFNEDPVDATPAVANSKVYLRTAENLYCFAEKAK